MPEASLLIAYFSRPGQNYVNGGIVDLSVGNTEVAARKLAALTGAPPLRIEQAESYPPDCHELTEVARRELKSAARPALKTALPDAADLDVLLLGYPNRWGTMPIPVWTFLEALDLSGKKKIAPFRANEGSGMGRSEKDLRALCPGAEILPGLALTGHKAADADGPLRAWAGKLPGWN